MSPCRIGLDLTAN